MKSYAVGSQRSRDASYRAMSSSCRRVSPISSSPSISRNRVKSSIANVSSTPGALTVRPSRSTTILVVGHSPALAALTVQTQPDALTKAGLGGSRGSD